MRKATWLLGIVLFSLLLGVALVACTFGTPPRPGVSRVLVACFLALTLIGVSWRCIRALGFAEVGVLALSAAVVPCLLIVLAAPDLLGALDRGRQRATLASMRELAGALEAVRAERGAYPSWGPGRAAEVLPRDFDAPRRDGWGAEFELEVGPGGVRIISYGLGSTPDAGLAGDYPPGKTTAFTDDIVLIDGSFWRYPEGTHLP